jgi:hypothetical protein
MRFVIHILAAIAFVWHLAGCMYVKHDWAPVATADAPWAAPGAKAQWQRRHWQMFLAPASHDEFRWADARGHGLLGEDDKKDAKYLRETPLARQWPDVASGGVLPPHTEPPFDFALVSVHPAIFVMWPRQAGLEYPKELGHVSLFPIASAYGITTLPPVEGLMWFSAELEVGPVAVPMLDAVHGQISWRGGEGGRLLLTRTSAGWVTERQMLLVRGM